MGATKSDDEEYGKKSDKYIMYAVTKAAVLFTNPDLSTSIEYESHAPEERIYLGENAIPAGGIALPTGEVLSFSGFSQGLDEALCIATALKMKLIDLTQAQEISNHGTKSSYELAIKLLPSDFISKSTNSNSS